MSTNLTTFAYSNTQQRGGKIYSNCVEIRKCCSSKNVLKMLAPPGQLDNWAGRCHSVGKSQCESQHTYIIIHHF